MEHVVFYPGADGAETYRRAADLEAAVHLVESLRNDHGIGDVSVFSLSPVPLAFRTYVHVELSSGAEAPAEQAPAGPSIPPPPLPPVPDLPVQDGPVSLDADTAPDLPGAPDVPAQPDLPDLTDPLGSPELPDLTDPLEPPAEAPSAPPAPPVDLPPAEQPLAPEAYQDELVAEPAENDDPAEAQGEWSPSEPVSDVAWAEHEVWAENEPVADEVWAESDGSGAFGFEPADWSEPAAAAPQPDQDQDHDPVQDDHGPIAIPYFEETEQDLPPLTLAPGPLLFDGDGTPITTTGSYDLVDEAQTELTDLIPADFTDLIPKDIVHGDLARHDDVAASVTEYAADLEAELPGPPELPEPPVVEAPVAEAPATDELPPMDVAEVPSDVSSIEALEANPIPAARETTDEPAPAHREGPRGLGFFGG